MESLFKQIFSGSQITPPGHIEEALHVTFKNPLNIEWHQREDLYEALFYKDNLEYIAHYTNNGILLDYRINQTEDILPDRIRSRVKSFGEVMNVISIHVPERVSHEVIIRDADLKRYKFLFDENGEVKEKREL